MTPPEMILFGENVASLLKTMTKAFKAKEREIFYRALISCLLWSIEQVRPGEAINVLQENAANAQRVVNPSAEDMEKLESVSEQMQLRFDRFGIEVDRSGRDKKTGERRRF